MIAALILVLTALPARAQDSSPAPVVVCGGMYGAEELKFKLNPLNGVLSAYSSGEDLMVFIDPSKEGRARVAYGHSVSEAEWERLKALRGEPGTPLYELLSRLGSSSVTQVWTGWTGDGYLHFEVAQRDLKFTFSCTKSASVPAKLQPFMSKELEAPRR